MEITGREGEKLIVPDPAPTVGEEWKRAFDYVRYHHQGELGERAMAYVYRLLQYGDTQYTPHALVSEVDCAHGRVGLALSKCIQHGLDGDIYQDILDSLGTIESDRPNTKSAFDGEYTLDPMSFLGDCGVWIKLPSDISSDKLDTIVDTYFERYCRSGWSAFDRRKGSGYQEFRRTGIRTVYSAVCSSLDGELFQELPEDFWDEIRGKRI